VRREAGCAPPVGPGSRPAGRLLDLGPCEPVRAQAFAESVAVSVAQGEAPNTLILCRPARPYVSIGFHQVSSEELHLAELQRRELPVIRRVTGGGTTYLDRSQVFYQLVYRPGEGSTWVGGPEDFAPALRAPLAVLEDLGLPARFRPPSDLVISGRKVSGNAGGTWEGANLLVGGLLGRADVEAMAAVVRCPSPSFRNFVQAEMARALTGLDQLLEHPPSARELSDRLRARFARLGPWELTPGHPLPAEEERFAQEVRPRHLDPAWVHLPPIPRPFTGVRRALRVAGSRHCLLLDGPGGEDRLVLVEGDQVLSAFHVGPRSGGTPEMRSIPPGSEAWEGLVRQVRSWAPG
jgi:lipoate-protein ligase A